MKEVMAIRGAIRVRLNSKEAIFNATVKLLKKLLEANSLETDDIISIFFTMTTDLDADFPARAARKVCGQLVPLLCAQEIDVPGALERVIRVLVHTKTELKKAEIKHIYLDGAEVLRPDLAGGVADDEGKKKA